MIHIAKGTLWTVSGGETAKECGRCATVWKNSWLDRDAAYNECPFCGAVFVKHYTVSRDRPKRKRLHWKMVQSIKTLCRLSTDLHTIDWKLFKSETYAKILRKRPSLMMMFNSALESLMTKLHGRTHD